MKSRTAFVDVCCACVLVGLTAATRAQDEVEAASDYLAMLGATHLRLSADADHFASLARQQDAVSVELRELVLRDADRKLRAPIPTVGRTWPVRALSKGTLFRLPWGSSPGRG